MKIVVSAQGPDLDAPVDPRFGRAACFLLYDLENDDFEAVDNEAGREAGQGAGVQAAQIVAGSGAEVLLTGHCGPKAHGLLSASGVKVYAGVEGSVREAVAQYREGALAPADAPDVEGHWS